MHTLSINKNVNYSAPIMFIPLGTPTTVKTTATSTIVHKPITPIKTPATPSYAKASADKPAIKADVKKPTTIATTTNVKKSTATTAANVKTEPPKPIIADVQEKKTITPTPPAASIKKDTPIVANTKPEPKLAQALDIQQPVIPVQPVEEIQNSPAVHVPINAQVSNNYREVEALRRGAQLQKELVNKWQPPLGVSPECTCEISFFVNKKGTIENLKMVKSSGVMMFDISARQALFSMKMPQWTHGKPLIINFKQ